MISIEVIIGDNVTEPLERFGKAMPAYLDKVLRLVGSQYRANLKKNYLAGQVIGRQSGDLVRSIYVGRARGRRHVYVVGQKAVVKRTNLGVVTVVRRSSDRVKLANIYEHPGGYVIEPKTAKVLVFEKDGKIVFTKRVRGRDRPFMSASSRNFPWDTAFEKTTDEVVLEAMKEAGVEGEKA